MNFSEPIKRPKIFIVDCDTSYGNRMKDHFLDRNKYEVSLYFDGQTCIDNLYKNPDVVILNCRLEPTDDRFSNGLDVLEEIKSLKKEVNVVMTSSDDDYGEAAQSIAKGAISFFDKSQNDFNQLDKILSELQLN